MFEFSKLHMNNFAFQRSVNDRYIDFRGMGGGADVSYFIPVIFKFYDNESQNFILHVRKKLKQSSFDVDFDVSFLFISVCLEYRWTCIFHTIVSFTFHLSLLHVAEEEASHNLLFTSHH